MARPTPKELEILEQFRENLSDVLPEFSEYRKSDMILITWLRAREMDLDKAEVMLRAHLKWRKESGFEEVQSFTHPQNYYDEFVWEMLGMDWEKCPVLFAKVGKWDIKKIIHRGEKQTLLQFINSIAAQVIAIAESRSVLPEDVVCQFVGIMDFGGYSYSQLASLQVVEFYKEIVKWFESNFPEIIKTIYVINAPRIFAILFALVKPILSPRTLSKIQIYGGNRKSWVPILRANIPEDCLLPELGGPRRGSRSHSIGHSRRISLETSEGSEKDKFIRVNVSSGEKLELEYQVAYPGSLLSWDFTIEGHDIGFSVSLNEKILFPVNRFSSKEGHIRGSISCEEDGCYILSFDNSYSVLRSKAIFLNVTIGPPDEDIEEEDGSGQEDEGTIPVRSESESDSTKL